MSFEIDMKRLISALLTEDDIGTMLRCHYEAERAARHALRLIDDSLPLARRGMQKYLSQMLNRLEMLGVPPHFLAPLRTLNSHRNSFGHRGQELITDKQASDLMNTVRRITPGFGEHWRLTVHGKRAFDKTYGEATTKERYVMSACTGVTFIGAFPEIARVAAAKT
ncbi:hypothetical protein [Mesorhizobium sp. ES1-4]|uniref:hypothetical protein n=1 Tax=Mesorhizobium sp. ES1-4 TaxID=2876627 RepID=UPI001CCE8986|nr:hypothetical protein [Mesorhizobium sp. ES1-4]MBZ9798800.1 hypothetical protein [Mesorhizobium sp. ES1-4]